MLYYFLPTLQMALLSHTFINKAVGRLSIFSLIFLFGCKGDSLKKEKTLFPEDFPEIAYNNPTNKLTEEKINLGRHIFYDKDLSNTRTVSCGSCHAQVHGFADHNLSLSFGIYNRLGKRNSPALSNLAWMTNYMWDGGIRHLDVMPIAPFTDSNEMGMTLPLVLERIREKPKYQKLILEAFGDTTVDETRILLPLSQFMLTLVSDESKYDKVRRGTEKFTNQELNGYKIFQKNCSLCHTEPITTSNNFEFNGVTTDSDPGRFRITQLEEDKHKFKVPSLRNIELTYPYMHDGSIFSLEGVINAYNNNSNYLINEKLPQMNLSKEEIQELVAFLKTLTDYSFISNLKISEIQ